MVAAAELPEVARIAGAMAATAEGTADTAGAVRSATSATGRDISPGTARRRPIDVIG